MKKLKKRKVRKWAFLFFLFFLRNKFRKPQDGRGDNTPPPPSCFVQAHLPSVTPKLDRNPLAHPSYRPLSSIARSKTGNRKLACGKPSDILAITTAQQLRSDRQAAIFRTICDVPSPLFGNPGRIRSSYNVGHLGKPTDSCRPCHSVTYEHPEVPDAIINLLSRPTPIHRYRHGSGSHRKQAQVPYVTSV
nr:uncharacterized protein LOC115271089 [Aedes albopictus]